MAQFCTVCGTQVEEGLRFCSQCGAAIAAAEPTVPEIPAISSSGASNQPSPVTAPAPGAPAAKSSSPVVKIIIIVVLFLVLLGAMGIGTCVYIAYRTNKSLGEKIKIDQNSKTIEIPTPGGPIRMGETSGETPKEVGGVEVYPGAEALGGGGQLSFGDKFQISGREFETEDSVDDVVTFYKQTYESNLKVMEADGQYSLSIDTGTPREPHVVTIAVSTDPDSGKTRIVMSSIGGKEAQ